MDAQEHTIIQYIYISLIFQQPLKDKVTYLKESHQLLCSFCNVKGALDHLINQSLYNTIQNILISWLHLFS